MQTSNTAQFFRTETDLARAEARARKADHNRHRGEAIALIGKILDLKVTEDDVYTAESGNILRQTCLLTGMTLRFFRGHTGPVSCIALYDTDDHQRFLISGSWDKTIKVWDIQTKKVLSSTLAHTDFVKCIIPIPSKKLLVSGSSDKTARIWDLSSLDRDKRAPLKSIGSLSGHTRPIDCLAYDESNDRLYTGDSMGVIQIWKIELSEDRSSCTQTLIADLRQHRTGVNSMYARDGYLWSASTDCTILLQRPDVDANQPPEGLSSIEHNEPVKFALLVPNPDTGALYLATASGEDIHTFDVGAFAEGEGEAEILATIDAHSDVVTALDIWMKQPVLERRHPDDEDVILRTPNGPLEPWIVSAGLDGTVRKWRLANYISPQTRETLSHTERDGGSGIRRGVLTAEEEKELDELLEDD